jgi:hypothetical protein
MYVNRGSVIEIILNQSVRLECCLFPSLINMCLHSILIERKDKIVSGIKIR